MTATALKTSDAPFTDERVRALIDQRLDEVLEERMGKVAEAKTPTLSIIATKGTMDMAYPPFILGSTAAALGWNVNIFFTFYGLELLKKKPDLKISPLGNPAMPMKMPFGPGWFRDIDWEIPNALVSTIPGFEALATSLMRKTIDQKGVASIELLREETLEAGAELYACQMTVDLFGLRHEDFIDEVAGWIGAASYLPMTQKSDVSLFV